MTQPNGTGPDQDAVAAEWAAMVGMADDEDEARAAKPASAPEDSLAASWADALRSDDLSGGGPGAATPAAAGQGGRALNQDEIDNLLGSSPSPPRKTSAPASCRSSTRRVTYERLPMLEIVFDRLERMLTTSVRNFTSENVDISLENITAQRFGDYLNSVPLPAMICDLQGGRVGQLRPDHRRQRHDLLDRRRAARRPARHRAHADRGPPLHHDRGVAGRAPDPPGPGRPRPGLRADHAHHLPLRAHGDQPALRGDRPAGQCLHRLQAADRARGPRRHASSS